ncbi:MAG: TrkH family potassium uptake protein [Eubacteriales bacterium]
MNRKMVFYMLGQITMLESILLILPAIVAICYREDCLWSLLITAALAFSVGLVLTLICRTGSKIIFAREGFLIVALSWLMLSAIGALPFVLAGEIPSYVDAFFETVSGFTTTGASILSSPEGMSHGLLFWRSFTHWIGGMGVLVMIVAIAPSKSGRSIHILRAEMPGPVVGKLVPRVRDTAKILYLIYIGMTVIEVILLLLGGMNLFESLIHTFGTAGTGGFGVRADSIGGYSPYLQWVIAIFMLLFGVNFNLYYLILTRHVLSALKSQELWVYLSVVAVSSILVIWNIYPMYATFGETVRTAVFQVSSIVTTTGYATADFNLWPGLSKAILLILMFIGGCAGSTAGGLKVSRIVLLLKTIKRDLQRLLHPRSVSAIKLEGKRLDEPTVSGASSYLALYCTLLVVCFLLISWEPFGLECNLSAVIACLNNVGPGFDLVGPTGSYGLYSDFSKIILSMAMLFGRLEIYPLLFLLTPSTWFRK